MSSPFFLFLAWLEVGITGHNFGRGPCKDHSTKVWLQLAQWSPRRRLKCEMLTDGGRTTDDGRKRMTRPGELKSDAKNKQTISKLEKQQTKERKQNTKIYQTKKNNDVFPLTEATLIKNEFMTLIFVCVIFEQALQKRMCAL